MLQLTHPEYLFFGLALVPLLLWWLVQRRGSVRHPTTSRLANLPPGRSRLAFWGGTLLRLLSLLCLLAALAGPRWPDMRTRITTEGIAIVMVVDVSGSMATPDFQWKGTNVSRIEAVKKAFRLFVEGGEEGDGPRLEGRPTDLIGLVAFGTWPDVVCPLTLSHSALLRLLDEQEARSFPGESQTNISDALAIALDRLRSAGPRRKVLILLSDGEHNVPIDNRNRVDSEVDWTPRRIAQYAATLGVPIYCIDAGGTGMSVTEAGVSTTPPELREQAFKTLQTVAEISGGRYFKADSTAGLFEVYRQIDRQEREPIESYQFRRYYEGYPWLALASFVLFVLVLALEMTIWRRIP
jgi:Ca-activated chloride channel family protein